ncbi:unnamed protein product, partial [Symbiodinium sp. KB8]
MPEAQGAMAWTSELLPMQQTELPQAASFSRQNAMPEAQGAMAWTSELLPMQQTELPQVALVPCSSLAGISEGQGTMPIWTDQSAAATADLFE